MSYKKELIITITEDMVKEYNKYIKENNPRIKKDRDIVPYCISLNKFTSMPNRIIQNSSKQMYKDFMMWICNKEGLSGSKIDDCEITYLTTYHDKRRHDNDNTMASKFYGDAMVESGVLSEDNYTVVKRVILESRYEKGVKRLDIIIRHN